MTPTVDVVIPVFNGETFIKAAIASVLDQTTKPARIIIIDDGSTDKTAEIVKNISRHAAIPINYYYQINKGLSSARNTGIRNSTSQFVAFLDVDDLWERDKLAQELRVFAQSKFKKLALVYCRYRLIDESGHPLNDPHEKFYPEVRGNIHQELLLGNKISGSSSAVLIKRSCFTKVGLFDESLTSSEDWDMWLRITQCYAVDYSPLTLVRIRRHSKGLQQNLSRMTLNDARVISKIIASDNLTSKEINHFQYLLLKRSLKSLPNLATAKALISGLSPKARRQLLLRSTTLKSLLLAAIDLWIPFFWNYRYAKN